MKFISSLFCLLCFAVFSTAHGQNYRVTQSISEIEFKTTQHAEGRIDIDSGVKRASYREQDRNVFYSAKAFLDSKKEAFGWQSPESDLELVSDRRLESSRHVTYQQTHNGVPVLDHRVRINLNQNGQVSMVFSSFEPVALNKEGFDTVPTFSGPVAAERALSLAARGRGRRTEAQLGIIQPQDPVLVWEVIVWPESEPAEYRVQINAHTGELVRLVNQAISLRGEDAPKIVRSDGTGLVFDPSPLYAAGVQYGAPYVDGNDATNSFLDAVRKSVVLKGLTQDQSNKWVLKGPFISISGDNGHGSQVYSPPAESSIDGFQYDRSHPGFEAVNTYYHLDKSQRYVQELGILNRLAEPFPVNPRALTSDDSFYWPDLKMIGFGTGGVDDAEDPTVLWHEYAHALLDDAAPGLLSTNEGRAFHEGWSDYWAASYLRSQVDSGASPRTDWRKMFAWDSGDGTIWSGRTLDHQGKYPQDLCVTTSNGCSVHDDGRMWATTMMEVYDQLGRAQTDRLSLLSHAYLVAPVTFSDAAEAVLQADLDYNDGANIAVLINVFSARGLINAGDYAPVLAHNELPDSEMLGDTIQVVATAVGVSSDIASVHLFSSSTSGGASQVAMVRSANNSYQANLALPAQLDSVFYYFRAEDSGGRVSFLPEDAPQSRFKFIVGEDRHAPVISHQPIVDAGFDRWPLKIWADVTDNFSVESVLVDYVFEDPSGAVINSGAQQLVATGTEFSTLLQIPFQNITVGSRLKYSIEATDGSVAKNSSRYPVEGSFEVEVTAEGRLRLGTYEATELNLWTATGLWEKGTPAYGKTAAFSGEGVIGTNLSDSYADEAGISVLQLEPLNLNGVAPSTLSFWHYYDTEHDGSVTPSSINGAVWDGGLVQYMSEQTLEWTALVPKAGYPGVIQNDVSNSFRGQPAFGGFSFGWQRSEINLPQEDNLVIRFVFATNATNSHPAVAYAGWIIDQLEVTTDPMVDLAAPERLTSPASTVIASVDDSLPVVSGSFSDNTGVAKVLMNWKLVQSSGTTTGSTWLTQDPEDPTLFSTQADMAFGAAPGDRLNYYLEASDSFANSLRIPEGSSQNAIIFRIKDEFNPLQATWASGAWAEVNHENWVVTGERMSLLSTLNSNPIQIPENAVDARLELTHSFQLGADMAGQVEISDNGGKTWSLLEPDSGYSGTASSTVFDSMTGKPAFLGSSNGTIHSSFDLAQFVGKQILLKVAAGSGEASNSSQKWTVLGINMSFESEDAAFNVPREFELLPTYPNPFSDRTNLAFTLPERLDVDIRVFDVLGREVQSVWKGVLGEGAHSVLVERQSLISGIYFVRVRAGSRVKTAKIVVSY